MRKIDKHYVSVIDKTLAEFDATHPRSAAQQTEYNKYQRINQLRDNIGRSPETPQPEDL